MVDERIEIRDAVAADMPAVQAIYNALVPTTTVAWTDRPQSLATRQAWFARAQEADLPVLVAELTPHRRTPTGQNSGRGTGTASGVVGFASYGPFRGNGMWTGYRHTMEHTIHLAEPQWGTGLGRILLEALIDRAVAAGVHVMVGAIDSGNTGSIAFHQRLGFEEVGRMPQIGCKFGRWLDLVLMQRILDDRPTP
ncbi:MAG: GNAT family N-acetyltransferase [Acidimicrobiales bacterium]